MVTLALAKFAAVACSWLEPVVAFWQSLQVRTALAAEAHAAAALVEDLTLQPISAAAADCSSRCHVRWASSAEQVVGQMSLSPIVDAVAVVIASVASVASAAAVVAVAAVVAAGAAVAVAVVGAAAVGF